MYVSGSVPLFVCTFSHISSLLGGAGDAGVLAVINVRQAYLGVHALHSVEQDESVQ